ncbi:uncharacterized protein V1518DRAFT_409203 [Limtongia smithiae]|uniref:uncharacterized protein n=1 Tax=Limtongia smithiae TaxID=1125753 RepID=UPI0034CE98D3
MIRQWFVWSGRAVASYPRVARARLRTPPQSQQTRWFAAEATATTQKEQKQHQEHIADDSQDSSLAPTPLSSTLVSRVARINTQQSLRRATSQRATSASVPLSSRRPTTSPNVPEHLIHLVLPCVSLTVADSYDLPKVLEILHQHGMLQASMLLPHDVAYVPYPLPTGHKADAFILSNGSIVTFGMTELQTIALADDLKLGEVRPYPMRESEDLDYIELPTDLLEREGQHRTEIRSYMEGEIIFVRGTERLLDKVAFASGLARSTKLAVIESELEQYLASIRDITDRLATGRKLPVHDGREVLKKTGELLSLRGNLNLYSELTEIPDLYWSEPELEEIYRAVSKTLDILPRIAILNKKLDYVSEVVSILKAHLSEEQSVRLEWMIIILIMVEVCFETCHFVEHYFDKLDKAATTPTTPTTPVD